jgi:hypothetical protein
MGQPNKRRKGKRWSRLGFIVFYVLFVTLAIQLKNTVNADSNETYVDSFASNITIKLLNVDNNNTGKQKKPNSQQFKSSLSLTLSAPI